MKKLIIGIVIACLSSGNLAAQTLKVISANRQGWSGGVAGHWGTNYSITVGPMSKDIVLDSMYISNMGIKLVQQVGGNVRIDSIHHSYNLFAGESHDDGMDGPDRIVKKQADNPAQRPLRKYSGAALILYEYKGKQYSLPVKKMDNLPGIAYP